MYVQIRADSSFATPSATAGPPNFRIPLDFFGMRTPLTGGGK